MMASLSGYICTTRSLSAMASLMRSLLFCFIFKFVVALFCLFTSPCLAEFLRMRKGIKQEKLSFLVLGDWGRNGEYEQIPVANQMAIVGEKDKIDLVISTGDNFYKNGLKNLEDPAFVKSFSEIYKAKSLRKPWYIVLGNRDYRGDVEAQLGLNTKDSRWNCHRSYILEAGFIEFFFVDTTPIVDKYFVYDPDRKYNYDWKGIKPNRKAYIRKLQQDLQSGLQRSKAEWKIVVGHHTIRSSGETGTTVEVETKLLPILQRNKVDMYINGHDHCLQYIFDTASKIHFITSGAGAKASKDRTKLKPAHKLHLHYGGEGFVSMQINRTDAAFVFYDAGGINLGKFTVSKPKPKPKPNPSY